MEEALIARLRASTAVAAVAGVFNGRPAIDVGERRSDQSAAFPAAHIQMMVPGRDYDQDGPQGLHIPRVRFECFGLTWLAAKRLSRAITEVLEVPATVSGIRFHRAKLVFERDMNAEDLDGGIRVFWTIRDMMIPYTPAA